VNDQTGERFETEIWANQASGWDKLATIAADAWKPFGVKINVGIIPPARVGDREYESGYPGLFVTNVQTDQFAAQGYVGRLDSRQTSAPSNRYNGTNRGGYSNPKVDGLYDQLVTAIEPKAQVPFHRALLQEVMGEV